ncbi:MAG: V-type ATP synthase subunit I [Bacteroidaceae bacterium]|nr:V-type ATP synthase subunit I [Bacteroidaceae bacterium]
MITRMKKLTFLVFYKEYEEFLEKLRDMGVVHVEVKQEGEIEDTALQRDVTLLSRSNAVVNALEPLVAAAKASEASKHTDAVADKASEAVSHEASLKGLSAEEILSRYDDLQAQRSAAEQRLAVLTKDIQTLEPWGDFDPEMIDKLAAAGYRMHFFCCPQKAYNDEWEKEYNAIVIRHDKQNVYFITVTPPDVEPDVDADICRLPHSSLKALHRDVEALQAEISSVDAQVSAFAAAAVPVLDEARDTLSDTIDFTRVRLTGEPVAADKLYLLQGWVPAKQVDDIRTALDESGQFYQIDDPTPEDNIPIELSNKKFAKLFEPLTKLYMLPSYRELDLTLFFAPFFMLFFGLCLGDMGYGLLMIVALPIFVKLFKLINPEFSKGLVILFGISTMLCGALSGNFFGFQLYDLQIPFVQKMKDLFYIDSSKMFTVSLGIGVVQILFGMILKAVNLSIQCGVKHALSTIGWIVLLVTVGVAALTGIGFHHPVVIALLALAAVGIFFFNSPGKNPLLNVGLGLWDTYNMATGLLGDVLSYVRLFALGLSGGILGQVFNSMAVGMSPKTPVIGFLVTALIFCVGHALNIFMNILGAIVHPMRLTFVEFFKNAGYTGGGEEYHPFRKVQKA